MAYVPICFFTISPTGKQIDLASMGTLSKFKRNSVLLDQHLCCRLHLKRVLNSLGVEIKQLPMSVKALEILLSRSY